METSMENQNELAWLKWDTSPAIGHKNCTQPRPSLCMESPIIPHGR